VPERGKFQVEVDEREPTKSIDITQIWEHRALKAEGALRDLGIIYQKLPKSSAEEIDALRRITNLEKTVNQHFPAHMAKTEKRIQEIGGRVEDLELRLSKGDDKPYPGHTDFDPTK